MGKRRGEERERVEGKERLLYEYTYIPVLDGKKIIIIIIITNGRDTAYAQSRAN